MFEFVQRLINTLQTNPTLIAQRLYLNQACGVKYTATVTAGPSPHGARKITL
jgi:hypothetical protein